MKDAINRWLPVSGKDALDSEPRHDAADLTWLPLRLGGAGAPKEIKASAEEGLGLLTFFTTAKPFKGHDGVIQRNALKSWKLLHPDIEVIVFGDDLGAAEVCEEYGLRHEPEVERYNSKFPFANAMFTRAQQIARHDYICYSNCDIVLFGDFLKAFESARLAKAFSVGFTTMGYGP